MAQMLHETSPSSAALVRHILCQAIPNALSELALVLVGFTTVLFVSQLHDSDIFDGVGVGTMLYNILGLSLGVGMTAGLETLVSQSNGAGLYYKSGIHFQHAVVVCTLVCIPASIIMFFTEDILLSIGQNAEVAARAGEYVLGTIPSLWPMYTSSAISTFLRAQTLPRASVYATWVSNVFHIFSCWFFIIKLNMGAFGAGLAFTATQLVSFSILLTYVHFIRPGVTQKSWIRWDWQRATSDLRSFIDKALPCAALMWAEWWCTEAMTLMAGYLGVVALAAHTSVLQLFVLIYMTSGGVSAAGAALVGNAIGAGSAELARRSALIAVIVMFVVCACMDAVLILGAHSLTRIFTGNPQVKESILVLLNILLLIVPLDSLQTVIDGILRGLGKQKVAFRVKMCCTWGVRFPLAFILGFYADLGVQGIWWGSAIGLATTMVIYVALAFRIDWQEEVAACAAQQEEHVAACDAQRTEETAACDAQRKEHVAAFDTQRTEEPAACDAQRKDEVADCEAQVEPRFQKDARQVSRRRCMRLSLALHLAIFVLVNAATWATWASTRSSGSQSEPAMGQPGGETHEHPYVPCPWPAWVTVGTVTLLFFHVANLLPLIMTKRPSGCPPWNYWVVANSAGVVGVLWAVFLLTEGPEDHAFAWPIIFTIVALVTCLITTAISCLSGVMNRSVGGEEEEVVGEATAIPPRASVR